MNTEKLEVLIRTNSDDEIKIARSEFKRLNLNFNENSNKMLRRHYLTEEEIQRINLSKIGVFKITTTNKAIKGSTIVDGVAMLISSNPLIWNR